MASKKHFVIFDPKTNTKIKYPMEGDFFGVTLKKAIGDLVKAIVKKTGQHPARILTDPTSNQFVLQVEPRERTKYDERNLES
jgi:hypothetical protein